MILLPQGIITRSVYYDVAANICCNVGLHRLCDIATVVLGCPSGVVMSTLKQKEIINQMVRKFVLAIRLPRLAESN